MLKKVINLFIKFFIEELKIIKTNVVNILVYFHDFNILNLLLSKIFNYKNCKIFKINEINDFINYNRKKLKNTFVKNLDKKIYVESFINHPIYTIQNCIIASATSKILKKECCGLLRKGDIKSKEIFSSFGINKIIYIDQGNIFTRFYNLIIAFNLLKNIKNIESLVKLKFENIEIGRAVYDQYLRFKKNPSTTSIVIDFYFFLSQALILNKQFKNIFKINTNTYLIQSETQYYPYTLCMQNAIKFNNLVISRRGHIAKIGIKIFSKKNKNFNENRNRPPKKLVQLVYKEIYKKSEGKIKSTKSNIFKLNIGNEIYQVINKNKNKKFFYSKKDVCNYFKFDEKKPIVLILAHELTDGNLHNSWNLFINDFFWLEETIQKIKKIKNVNWIIKSHPSEKIYNCKIKTADIYNKSAKKNQNIKLFPENFNIKNFHKFTSVAISSHGTASGEYPLKSIPTIVCGESTSSNFGFNIVPKNKNEYFKILSKISKLKKLKDGMIKKCYAFNCLLEYVSLENMPISFETDITMNFDKKFFWKKTLKLRKRNKIYSNSFEKSLEFLLKNDCSYLINLKRFKNLNSLFN